MNSNENYNSENNSDYSSFVEDSNCDNENDSDKNDFISSSMQRTSRIVNVVISQMMQINPTAAQFLADHNQNNQNDIFEKNDLNFLKKICEHFRLNE